MVSMVLVDKRVCDHQEAGKRTVLRLVVNCFCVQYTFGVSLEPRIGPDVSPDRMAKRADCTRYWVSCLTELLTSSVRT